ncbi:hypothetical protein ACSAZL_12630 [Methanosarcina sp. T3]|uniref:hypothetical protein n=1 Tax=Methanosarcina sp. T3 TaxID=3439062 RepID=UPI003F870DE9
MEKLGKVIRYGSYLTVILIMFSILSPAALAKSGNGASKGADEVQSLDTVQTKIKEKVQERNQTENGTLAREQLRDEIQERTQLKEQLKIQKNNYQTSKQNFLQIRAKLRSGNYDEEDLDTARTYLNSSIDYMIANLEKVRYNLDQSNGNGTEARIAAIDERIRQLEEEKEAIGNAADFEELAIAANSVRGTWNNAKNSTIAETGKTVSERIDLFLDKSEDIAGRLESEINAANETGAETVELEAKLADYNELMDSARENKEAAEEIFDKEDATQEELEEANEYLQDALEDIRDANEILKEIFSELELYREQYRLEEQNQETAQTNDEEVDDSSDDEVEDEEDIEGAEDTEEDTGEEDTEEEDTEEEAQDAMTTNSTEEISS